jgi:uncharacterized protein (TIGR00255 family)
MVLSMTGYGRSAFVINGKNAVVEIRTLNSKSFDINLRLSLMFREHEMEIRNMLNKKIVRGKTDCTIAFEQSDEKNGELNPTLIKEYYRQLISLAKELNGDESKIFEIIFRLPNITQTSPDKLTEEQIQLVEEHVAIACSQIDKFRRDEGDNLEKDLILRTQMMLYALTDIEKLDPSRVEQQRNKLLADLRNHVLNEEIDNNRFEQELIFYLEKMDINEEVIRLKSHCEYFLQSMHDTSVEKGKKLGFICQEINREINTIGSKAYHAEMQRKVVEMKDELEKIKEQLNNVL